MEDLPFYAGISQLCRERGGEASPPWLDRAELDALFARRHPRMADRAIPLVSHHLLRADPPVRLLLPDPARATPIRSVMRFCRIFSRRKSIADDVLADGLRRRHVAGTGERRRQQWPRYPRSPSPSRGIGDLARKPRTRICDYRRWLATCPARCQGHEFGKRPGLSAIRPGRLPAVACKSCQPWSAGGPKTSRSVASHSLRSRFHCVPLGERSRRMRHARSGRIPD